MALRLAYRRAMRWMAALFLATTPAEPATVPLVIHTDSSDTAIKHSLSTTDGTLLEICKGNCTLEVPPGMYVLESSETDDHRPGSRTIVVMGPTTVNVKPGSKTMAGTGITLAIVGPVIALTGVAGLLFDKPRDCDHDCPLNPPDPPIWKITTGVGVAMGLVGLGLYAASTTTIRARPSTVAIVPSLTPAMQGATLTLRF